MDGDADRMRDPYSGPERILLTGISGFIGHRLAESLKSDYEVHGLVRESSTNYQTLEDLRGDVIFHKGDLKDFPIISQIISNIEPSYIIHLGAITPVSYSFSHPLEVNRVNYMGTINVAESARKLEDLRGFIFSSSAEVYGNQRDKGPYSEERDLKPASPYAVSKIASENYLRYMYDIYNFPFIALRQTNTPGREHNSYFVMEAFISSMLEENKVVDFGSPEPLRAFLYISDLERLYHRLLDNFNPDMTGEIYNTGPPNAIKIKELAMKIRDLTNFGGSINWNTKEKRLGEVWCLNTSHKKIEKRIGWSPSTPLDEGLESTVDFWRDKIERSETTN